MSAGEDHRREAASAPRAVAHTAAKAGGPDRVSFIVAGAQKSGTQALDRYLREHPELCLPRLVPVGNAMTGEVHFFDTDSFFWSENVDYSAYHAKFEARPSQRLLGEVTPAYLYWPTAAERIARYNPAMKIIVVLRNPITRAYSHWNKSRRGHRDPLPFLEAVRAEPQRLRGLPLRKAMRFNYVERGFYVAQLQRLWRYFPVAQTLVLRTEELLESPSAALSKIAGFLGIAPFAAVASKSVNAGEYEAPMSAEARRFLAGVFEQEIHELERLLGWDCSQWLALGGPG
jgi:hypothetical protein